MDVSGAAILLIPAVIFGWMIIYIHLDNERARKAKQWPYGPYTGPITGPGQRGD